MDFLAQYIPSAIEFNADLETSDLVKGCDAGTRKTWVLVIEDETLIGLDLCDTLSSAGYQVLGPATTASAARLLIEGGQTPDVAIVDVRLSDGLCTEIAHLLRKRRIPFFTCSGYGQHAASLEGFADAPWLAEPASPGDIMRLLGELSVPNLVHHAAHRAGAFIHRLAAPPILLPYPAATGRLDDVVGSLAEVDPRA